MNGTYKMRYGFVPDHIGACLGKAMINEIRSNVIRDSSGFCFASQETIMQSDFTGYNQYVLIPKGKIVVINPRLEGVREYEKDQIYRYYFPYQDLRFLLKGNNRLSSTRTIQS